VKPANFLLCSHLPCLQAQGNGRAELSYKIPGDSYLPLLILRTWFLEVPLFTGSSFVTAVSDTLKRDF
jgi:hypothetical protein